MKISIFSLIIAIAVAILSLFQFERYQNLESATEAHIAALSTTLNPKIQSLQQDISKLANQETRLATQVPTTISVVTEVEYLTNMAAMTLQTTGDIDTATHLLKIAEAKLQNVNDIKMASLRQTLTEDRLALQAVKQANLTEIWEQISRMMEEVPALSLSGLRNNTKKVPEEKIISSATLTQSTDENQSWKQALEKSWQHIKDLIKIRHHTKPIEPILSETEAQLAKQNLLLLLEQLRLSLLQKNQTIYNNLIKENKRWLETYFEAIDPKVIDMLHTLTDLEQVILKPVLPNLSSKQMLLRLGAELRATAVYIKVNEDCEIRKATMHEKYLQRGYNVVLLNYNH